MNDLEKILLAGQILYTRIRVGTFLDGRGYVYLSDADYNSVSNIIEIKFSNADMEIDREDYRRFILNMLFKIWTAVFGELEDKERLNTRYNSNSQRWECHL